MKAVFIAEHGDVDKLIYGDRPDPAAGPGEVVVRVRASALNHLDLGVRSGRGRGPGSLPRILGCDMAGEVHELGSGVTGLDVGNRVLVDNRIKCDDCTECLQGMDQLCPRQLRIGVDVDGGHAELCRVPAVKQTGTLLESQCYGGCEQKGQEQRGAYAHMRRHEGATRMPASQVQAAAEARCDRPGLPHYYFTFA